jgi:hypothetical protein
MELLGDMGHVKSCFGPFGDGVSIGARLVHGLRPTYYWLRNHFRHTQWSPLVIGLKWKLFCVFRDSANLDEI